MNTQTSLDLQWALHCLEHLEELVLVTDAERGGSGAGGPYVRYVNAAFERCTGWRRAEVIGQPLRSLGGAGTAQATLAQIRAAYLQGQATEVELETQRRDGSAMSLRSRLLPLRADGEGLRGFLFLQSDLTEARAVRSERARLAEWFAGAASSALAALYITSVVRADTGEVLDFRVEYANRMGGELLRADPRALVGQTIRECVPGSRTEVLIQNCRRVLASGLPFVEEFEVVEHPPELRWMRHQIVPLKDGVAITAENITARKTVELDLKQRETMLQAFLDNCPGFAWIADERACTLAANAAYLRLMEHLGVPDLPMPMSRVFAPELTELYARNNLRVIESGQAERMLEPGLRADGSSGLFETFKFPLGVRNGVRLVGGISIDITEREGQHQASERLAAIVRSSGDAILSLDLDGRIVSWNHGAELLYGFRESEVLGRPVELLVPEALQPEARQRLQRVLAGATLQRRESLRCCRDGSEAWVLLSMSPIQDRDGRCVGVSEIASDIGERHRREQQSRYFAEHDPVTGALNERGLLLVAQRWIERVPAHPLLLLRVRVERFGEFREAFGLAHGHALLGQVVERLTRCLDGIEHRVAHFGQNEFALLIDLPADEGAPHGALQTAALDLLARAQRTPLQVIGIEFDLELRGGLAAFPHDAADAEALLRCADLAMAGSARGLSTYRAEMGERVAQQVRLQRELARALVRGQLRLLLQPIVDARPPFRVLGVEALLRWRHPELGEVPPARFVPVAEESGLIVPIGGYVIEEACRLKAWLQTKGHGQLFMSLNVSPDQFRHGDLPVRFAQALQTHGLDGRGLELEITESTLMEHTEATASQLQALAALGLGLSIDDFGTGWSSLAYLHRFPLTKLKVDRSFVSALPQDHTVAAIVRSILTLARSLELSTLAEGVETEPQQALLSGLGCTQLQGFLHSRPLEPEALLAWLDSRS